jgi:hypothetical protein
MLDISWAIVSDLALTVHTLAKGFPQQRLLYLRMPITILVRIGGIIFYRSIPSILVLREHRRDLAFD